jgi:demethylmenaquinone methyltransferase/2-methoxy-6-polyprenyl-1,4-benzoquinol methylase
MSFGTTHFGYKRVPINEKPKLVAGVFSSIAEKYDLMNDVMSMGLHRLIKRMAVRVSEVILDDYVLDLAGGTGDLTIHFSRIVGINGHVILADINESMLKAGQRRLSRIGICKNVTYMKTDAQHLPFDNNSFDCVTISFGIRNFTDERAALHSVKRVLKPNENRLLQKAYHLYSFGFVPIAGRVFTGDGNSYRYLAESIKMHPDQETLRRMMEETGFSGCHYFDIMNGIVALHKGTKPRG